MIKLEQITKIYPRSTKPAVENVTFEVPEGETCVLIGPSGCGKTTTLKMVNRLIEPSNGKITLAGQDVMEQDPVELRRNIGYVIQQIGLFPHMTIRDNIAVVPKLLGWDAARIDRRVDELLEMVSMDPNQFRARFPRELSGGQCQRIGVIRALAGDPPVMLMDEPFGAIDPITRDSLQNEFIRLQKRLKKTIMFVTHDIDEAIKMSTLICILQVGGVVQQVDSPKNILANPANDFVSDFVGADRGLKRLSLVRVGEIMSTDIRTAQTTESTDDVVERMLRNDCDNELVIDDTGKLVGYISLGPAQNNPGRKVGDFIHEIIAVTEEEATMKNVFSEMLSFGIAYMPVVGAGKKVVGIVTVGDAQRLIQTQYNN